MTATHRICVVGLGKIGLALAAQYASKGFPVFGADVDPDLVALINSGQVPPNSEEGLLGRVQRAVSDGLLKATANTADAVRASTVVVIIVPLLVDAIGRPTSTPSTARPRPWPRV